MSCFLDLLYPPRCIFCHRLVESSAQTVCKACAESLPYAIGAGQRRKVTFVSQCVSPLYYEGLVRDSFLRYKFGGTTGYAEVYGKYIAKSVDENEITCDIITWVPLSRRRLRKRGYDQARLLAETVATHMGVECRRVVVKSVHNAAQSSTGDAARRRANVSGAYKVSDPESVKGKSILLVDDVVTTGSTLSECARVLLMAGASKVSAATLARKRE